MIQYIARIHSSKDQAKHHKQTCNADHSVYMKDVTFEELCDLHDVGCTFARIGKTTNFLVIDVDKSTINIKQLIEFYKDNPNYHISYSASNNPLKYHIFIKLDHYISESEYDSVLETEFQKIHTDVCGRCDYMILDKNASNFYQCFYGTSADYECDYILENSTRLFKWCKKNESPMLFKEDKTFKKRPSMNSADFCKKNKLLTIKENKRFDVILPSMTNGKLKLIAEGFRFNWCRMTGTKILMRILYLNHDFNENWTKWDFLDTAEWAFRTNIIKPDSMESEIKTLLLWLDNKWDILVTKSYEDQCKILEPYFNCSKKQYKSRSYNPTVMSQLIQEHQIDSTTILFTDKDELKDLCKELMIDYYKFIKFANSVHFKVAFECISDKRIKHDCSNMTKEQFDAYCKENNLSKQLKYRLKKQYNIN